MVDIINFSQHRAKHSGDEHYTKLIINRLQEQGYLNGVYPPNITIEYGATRIKYWPECLEEE